MAGAALLVTPTQGSFMEGFDGRMEKNSARRKENRDALMKLGEEMSSQGVGFGIDEWAQQAQALLGTGDMLNSTALAPDMLEAMRRSQNSKAGQVAEERRRAQFRNDQEESNMIEADIAKQAVSGKSPVEITSYLKDTYGQRADKVIPRIDALANKATIDGQRQGFEFGAQLLTEEEARNFVSSNPGLTEPMKQGVIQRARQNQMELEKQSYSIGERVGSSGGFVDNDDSRRAIETLIPSYVTNPAVRAQMTENALKVARASAQTKLAGTQSANTAAAQLNWAQNAPQQALQMAQAEAADYERRRKDASAMESSMTGAIASQDQFVKEMVGGVKGGKPLSGPIKDRLTGYAATYVISDPEGLMRALRANDEEAVKRVIATSTPKKVQQERARRVSEFINRGDKFPDADAAISELQQIAVEPQEVLKIGTTYKALMDGAGTAGSTAFRTEQRKVKVPVTNAGGAVIGYNTEMREVRVPLGGGASQDQQAQAIAAEQVKTSFVRDSAEMLIASQRALQAQGAFEVSPEQVRQMATGIVGRQARQFVAGMGLQGRAADEMASKIAADILNSAGELSGTRRVPTAVERYRENIERMRQQGGVMNPSSIVPGSVQPSPRMAPTGAAPGYRTEQGMRGMAAGDMGADPAAVRREIAALERDITRVTDAPSREMMQEQIGYLRSLQARIGG